MEGGRDETGGGDSPRRSRRHPREWGPEPRPEPAPGTGAGSRASEAAGVIRTAYDRKEIHERFEWLGDDALKKIPIVPEGARLRQGATYIDLNDRRPREFTATGDMLADRGRYFVPKEEVPNTIWDRLTGREEPPPRS